MRIATWNLEWASGHRHVAARRHLENVDADLIVTTEDRAVPWSSYSHALDGGDDWGYHSQPDSRKVVIWSRDPIVRVDVETSGAATGRLVTARFAGDPPCIVVAVCIPWAAAHVSTGRRDRQRWDEHLEFCQTLRTVLAGLRSTGPVIVAGDFNQRVPRRMQPVRAWDALCGALEGLDVWSSDDRSDVALIDHVACTPDLTMTDLGSWSNVVAGTRLSDHAGVWVDAEHVRT
jgi:exonuclease III